MNANGLRYAVVADLSNQYKLKYEDKIMNTEKSINEEKGNAVLQLVSNRIYTVVDQDGDLINCWKNKEDAEKHAEDLRKKHGTHFEATEEPLF